jgi:hypothetical protein
MLDVHPPHTPTHTWKDFFIHIATIVVGLIIAVGLEQSVELIHQHNERAELRRSLHDDGQKTLFDCHNTELSLETDLHVIGIRIAQVRAALYDHVPLAALPISRASDFDEPADPTWNAAKTSGLVNLLSQQEVQAYSEISDLTDYVSADHKQYLETGNAVRQFYLRFKVARDGHSPDLSNATPADLSTYLDLLAVSYSARRNFLLWTEQLHGGQEAVLDGERNLNRMQHNERKYDSLPPPPPNLDAPK